MLIVGGAAQGKLAFARRELGVAAWSDGALGEADCVYGLHQALRTLQEPRSALAAWLAAHPEGVIICDEVGCGVGRICCELAEQAAAVYRVCCGLGAQLK